MQQLAQGPSQRRPFSTPYGLVSLWDMINCHVQEAYVFLKLLSMEEDEANRHAVQHETAGGIAPLVQVDAKTLRRLDGIVDGCKKHFSALGADAVDDQLAHISNKGLRSYGKTWRQYHSDIVALRAAIERELTRHFFYRYPRDKGLMVSRVDQEWSAVLAAFPAARNDVVSAVDCYALGHHQAAIYHCMMVLERGLPAFADRLKARVKKDRPTWRDMTDVIRAEIDRRRVALASPPKGGKSLKRAAAKREHDFLGLCGEAALDFKFFEHAWRNHIAHGRKDNYDENDAKKVLDHTKTFMDAITSKLKIHEK